MIRRLVVVMALCFCGCTTAAAAATPRDDHRPCESRGERTVVATDFARVFVAHRRPGAEREYYGCETGRQRDLRLSTAWSRSTCSHHFFQLSDTIVAYGVTGCSGGRRFVARAVDIGKRRQIARAAGNGSLRNLLLMGGGSIVFVVQRPDGGFSVSKVEPGGKRKRLAVSRGIVAESLALGRGIAYWRQNGATRARSIYVAPGYARRDASSAAAPSLSASSRTCTRKTGTTLEDNGRARVFTDSYGDSYYGCVEGSQRTVFLGQDHEGGSSTFSGYSDFQLAGPLVGFAGESCGINACYYSAETVDLRT